MWDIKLKAMNIQTRQTNKNSQTQTTVRWLPEGKLRGWAVKGRGVQIYGDRRPDLGWWAHNAKYK